MLTLSELPKLIDEMDIEEELKIRLLLYLIELTK